MASGDVKTYPALLPLSWLYSLVTRGRNLLFDWGVLEERQFDVPVITVGNLTVGGTGKTPHVEHLVRLLRGEIGSFEILHLHIVCFVAGNEQRGAAFREQV